MEGWNSWRVSNMGLLNIGKKEGYVYILDSRAVLFGGDANNLTDRVLKILNDQYSVKGKK